MRIKAKKVFFTNRAFFFAFNMDCYKNMVKTYTKRKNTHLKFVLSQNIIFLTFFTKKAIKRIRQLYICKELDVFKKGTRGIISTTKVFKCFN